MSVRDCDGWVRSLHDQHIAFTGTIEIDGQRVVRADCTDRVYKAGAHYVADDFSNSLTLLVYGDLPANTVADTKRVYSDKLVSVQQARAQRRPHVHVVDADGFADLLEGKPARCQRLRAPKGTIVIPPPRGGRVFGGPLVHRRPTVRSAKALTIDLGALDASTAAHEMLSGFSEST